jgi:peroxiredoxin
VIGITPQARENVEQLRERTLRDARFDAAAHANHDAFWQDPASAFPLTLISDPEGTLSRPTGAERESHWSGPMVHPTTFVVDERGVIRWTFQSKMAQRRPSPVRLAAIAAAVANNEPVPEYVEE